MILINPFIFSSAWGYEFDAALGVEWVQYGANFTVSVAAGELTAVKGNTANGYVYAPVTMADGEIISARLRKSAGSYVGLTLVGSNGNIIAIIITASTTGYIQRQSSTTGFQANYGSLIAPGFDPSTFHFSHFRRSGSDLIPETSADGVTWATHTSVPLADLGGSIVGAGFIAFTNTTVKADWIRKA